MNKKCCFLDCEGKGKESYGNYCYKHRNNYLIQNNIIDYKRYTFESKDYLIYELENYYKFIMKKTYKKMKKEKIFNEVNNFIKNIKKYEKENIKSIIYIQSYIRGYNIRKRYNYIKCNNEEDFYSYEKLKDIKRKYFYSYCDKNNIYWGFDIRSLEKLIDLNYPNPYTTEIISPRIINDVKIKINEIKKNNSYENISELMENDRKNNIKQKCVDLFLCIEQSGYSCQIEWFLNLSLFKTKELYKQLEDIWNYRSQLSQAMKIELCPPDGKIFTIPIPEILNMNKQEIQEIILNDINKFNNCVNLSNRRLGYMYFIIGLSNVSSQCYLTHQDWLAFIQ